MLLITSAAYIDQGLRTEFGKIPPSFLPLQNKRLFEHQFKISDEKQIHLSVPDSYNISKVDQELLNKNKIIINRVSENICLGESIYKILSDLTFTNDNTLTILHGDTLFSTLPTKSDIYFISKTTDNYNWADSELKNDFKYVYSGAFSFSNPPIFIKLLKINNYDFVKSIKDYKNHNNVIEEKNDSWLDFGHVNTFYRSKTKFTTQRNFNNLTINADLVRKSSSNSKKITAESEWYSNVPKEIKIYTPKLLDKSNDTNSSSYELEYLYLSSLSDLFVFGKNKKFVWKTIIDRCIDFLNLTSSYTINKSKFKTNFLSLDHLFENTEKRLSLFSLENDINLDREWIFNNKKFMSINSLKNNLFTEIEKIKSEKMISLIHGDFCFSNILFDFRKMNIKVIDPRGIDFKNNITMYGDYRYDIAKLSHSIIGLYDFIISGFYTLNSNFYNLNFEIYNNKNSLEIQQYFLNKNINNKKIIDIKSQCLMINLFLSMLPLHNDNKQRQLALLSNSFRLFNDLNKL